MSTRLLGASHNIVAKIKRAFYPLYIRHPNTQKVKDFMGAQKTAILVVFCAFSL